jgi:thymidylate synthase
MSKNNHPEYQYINILKKLLKEGSEHDDRTGTGTLRTWGEKMEFDLSDGSIPMITTRKMFSRIAIEELLWFLQGSTDVKKLQEKNVKIWNGNGSLEECLKFDREEGDLGPIYGHQWRNFNASKRSEPLKEDYWSEKNLRWVNRSYNDDGYDQIKYVIDCILNNPNSRRIIFSGWHASEAHMVNPPPCHTFYQFQVENGRLNASLTQRSGDTFLGIVTNLISLSLMVNLFATVCDLKPGKIVHLINDCHLYKDHIEQAKIQVTREPFPFPNIKINDRLRGMGLKGLMEAKLDDFKIIGYQSHEKLTGKMSV